MPPHITDHFIAAADGLHLYAREYAPQQPSAALPVVCLPGLTRTAEDFLELATALSLDATAPRRVLALDYRGRGLSEYDADPAKYSLPVELGDVIAVMTALKASPAIVVGTSRGGLLAMLLGTVRLDMIAGVVFNDIGPVLERAGLARIKGYVGKLPPATTFEQAAANLRSLFGDQFPKLTEAAWLATAHRAFKLQNGKLVATYDPQIAKALEAFDLEQPIPAMWKEFETLNKVPVMVIRGALSDLLSAETVALMKEHHPALEALEVADQGHAPLLAEPETIARVVAFAKRCDP